MSRDMTWKQECHIKLDNHKCSVMESFHISSNNWKESHRLKSASYQMLHFDCKLFFSERYFYYLQRGHFVLHDSNVRLCRAPLTVEDDLNQVWFLHHLVLDILIISSSL